MTQSALVADPDVPVDELTMALWADALDKQSKEVCQTYGIPYVPVVYYQTFETLPIDGTVRVMRVMTSLDAPGALGFHDLNLAGVPFSNCLWQGPDDTSVTTSHEQCEEDGDPGCNDYKPYNDKDEQAFELSDRVEGDEYTISATVGSVTRDVKMSNWLLPSAFDPNGKAPFDKMNRLDVWNGMTEGGYIILRAKDTGEVSNVFARHRQQPRIVPASPKAHAAIARRLGRPDSRMMRRLRGGDAPPIHLAALANVMQKVKTDASAMGEILASLQAEVLRLQALNASLLLTAAGK